MDYVRYLFSFKGRINRTRYIVIQLALLTVWFLLWVKAPFQQREILGLAAVVPMIWINLATTAKRLHDRNRNGWWSVAVFVANQLSYLYYGLLFGRYFGVDISGAEQLLLLLFAVALSLLQTWIVIELFFLIGTDGPNRFGPDPLSSIRTGAPTFSRTDRQGVPAFLVQSAGPSRLTPG